MSVVRDIRRVGRTDRRRQSVLDAVLCRGCRSAAVVLVPRPRRQRIAASTTTKAGTAESCRRCRHRTHFARPPPCRPAPPSTVGRAPSQSRHTGPDSSTRKQPALRRTTTSSGTARSFRRSNIGRFRRRLRLWPPYRTRTSYVVDMRSAGGDGCWSPAAYSTYRVLLRFQADERPRTRRSSRA